MENYYWCRDCEIKFRTESSHDEFEQAECPSCKITCLTFDFELAEAEREMASERAANRGSSAIIVAIFGWLGLLATSSPPHSFSDSKIVKNMDGTLARPSVYSAFELDEAKKINRVLSDNGVISEVKQTIDQFGIRFLVIVDSRDRNRARRLLALD